MASLSVQDFKIIIKNFVDDKISVQKFIKAFLKKRRKMINDEKIYYSVSEKERHLLTNMFYYIDDYWSDDATRKEGDLDEEGLREKAKMILDELNNL